MDIMAAANGLLFFGYLDHLLRRAINKNVKQTWLPVLPPYMATLNEDVYSRGQLNRLGQQCSSCI